MCGRPGSVGDAADNPTRRRLSRVQSAAPMLAAIMGFLARSFTAGLMAFEETHVTRLGTVL